MTVSFVRFSLSLASSGASAAVLLVRCPALLLRAGLPLVPGWLGWVGWGVRLSLPSLISCCAGVCGVNAFPRPCTALARILIN